MKILVTGAAGRIGTELCRELAANHTVRGFPLCQVSCRLRGGWGWRGSPCGERSEPQGEPLARPPGPVLSELRWGRERVTQCHIQRDLKREWSASWPIGMDPVPPSWPRR